MQKLTPDRQKVIDQLLADEAAGKLDATRQAQLGKLRAAGLVPAKESAQDAPLVPGEGTPGLAAKPGEVEGGGALLDKSVRFVEDIAYPGMGAYAGGVAGASLGPPGIAAGAATGAAAGTALKHNVRQLTGRQTETPEEIAADIGTSTLFGPMQEARAIMPSKAGKVLTPTQALGAEFGVPMSRAQQTQGKMASAFESQVRRAFGTQGLFRDRLDIPANKALVKAAESLADEISQAKGTQKEIGVYVQKALNDADKTAGNLYDQALQVITQAGGDKVKVPVKGSLQDAAKRLIREIELPPEFSKGLEKVEGRQMALGILENFTSATKTVERQAATGAINAAGQPIMQTRPAQVAKTLTFEEARRLRSQIFALVNSGEVTIGKGSLAQFNRELDAAMKDALRREGQGQLATLFEKASENYHKVQDLLEHSTISRLIKNDKPELVAEMLLQRGSETSAQTLRTLIGPQKMQVVERALWEKMFTNVLERHDGVVVGNTLERAFNGLGTETQKAIWGGRPELLGKIQRFVRLADTVSLKSSLSNPLSAQPTSLMGLMQTGSIGVAAINAGKAALTLDATGFAINVGSAGTMYLLPSTVARWMTRPDAIDVATKALQTQANSKTGRELAYKLMILVQAQEQSENLKKLTRQHMTPRESRNIAEVAPF